MQPMPPISKYMTPMPHTIGEDIPVEKALAMMNEFEIRHLPVLSGGSLIGVLTDRDLKLATSIDSPITLKVGDVMMPDPYTVHPNDSLANTVFQMAEHKYGCAIVQEEHGKVVGIFTSNDGLRVLGEVLQKNYSAKGA